MGEFVIDQFEFHARATPDSCVLATEEGSSFTYDYVNKKANIIQQIVYQLICQENELETTPLISVMTDRNVSYIVAVLGILKAGSAYVPVDPAFPPDRQVHIFTHSQCKFLIIDEYSLQLALSLGVDLPPYIKLDSNGNIIDIQIPHLNMTIDYPIDSIVSYRNHNKENRLAYVLYTSGSTGKPKGVMVKNIGVYNIINWFANELKVNSDSRVMGLTTFCFDISVLEIFLPLTRGGTLILAKSSTQKDPFTLLDIIAREAVTVFQATPTTYEMMLATGWIGDKQIDFLVGGEAFRPTLLTIAQSCRSFRNVYGPTETTIWSTSYTITQTWVEQQQQLLLLSHPTTTATSSSSSASTARSITIPIGSAISETDLYIVSEEMPYKVMPDYEEGELWIGGVGVAAGYLHAPDLTIQRFMPNPFGAGYIYRTGDIVKQIPHTQPPEYIFVRRMDDQVKIGGFRIELQEIETVYMQHPAVEQAIALVRNNKLVLYMKLVNICKDDIEKNIKYKSLVDDIHAQSKRKLTYYMIPKITVIIDNIPKTANGKLDKKALPDPSESIVEEEEMEVDPAAVNSTESSSDTQGREGDADEKELKQGYKATMKMKYPRIMTVREHQERVLAEHICGIVHKLRGKRPTLQSSFAAIGVDSLGAVVFVRTLSSDLDNYRVIPGMIFSSGMTIIKLSETLLPELKISKPHVLIKLGIDITANDTEIWKDPSIDTHDITVFCKSHVCDDGEEYDIDEDEEESGLLHIRKFHESFEESYQASIAASRDVLEGIRGFFTFMVLWDHYAPLKYASAWQADTALFVLISGFTTCLQLRYTGTIKATSTGLLYVKDPPAFEWKQFIISRALGVFPVLYIAFFMFIHIWITDTRPNHQACTVLYILGMQSWWRPACHNTGPNIYLYGSIIWNVFLIYTILRFVLNKAQRYLLKKWGSASVEGNIMTQITYNKPDPMFSLFLIPFYLTMIVALGLFGRYYSIAKNALFFMPYFLMGVFGANMMECFVYVTNWYKYFKNTPMELQLDIWKYLRTQLAPYVVKSDIHQSLLPQSSTPKRTQRTASIFAMSDVYDKQVVQDHLDSSPYKGIINTSLKILWRFLPDLLVICGGIELSTIYNLQNPDLQEDVKGLYIHLTFLLLMIVYVLQSGIHRLNISRYVFSTYPMTILGYTSYPVYLFQRIMLENYIVLLEQRIHPENGLQNFRNLPLWERTLSVLLVIFYSWVVQKFIVDRLIAYVYPIIMKCVK